MQENVTPDVAITCWVTLQILPDLLLEYKLFEFVNIADDLQHIVRETPWYREADNRNLRSINLHSYQGLDRQPGVRNPMKIQPLEVCGVEAIVISKTDVLVLTNTQTAFKKVVISEKDKLPPVGTSVKINARLLELLGFYAIITFKIENKALKGTHEDKLRVTIKKCPEVPGFVFCEFYGIYLDDPENVLEKWYFSKYSNSGLAVALISGAPSLNGKARYYVAEIIDDKKEEEN
ncbi:unnamed protein product [Caenorhabditis angaria]|uniref:Uncharacterized protein n=1 Tax=Caenorhabditis angaria TaxID=860376 RepID=A0A9P1N1U9_9PELO|nr:unnamed protein product [Caenorhabditis angaria]